MVSLFDEKNESDPMSASRALSSEPSEDQLVALLRQHAEPLPALDEPRFADAFERYADARVVLIGEASHGTSEFYRARAAITRRLIEQHGFSIVAVEADWPDAARIDCHCRQREPIAWAKNAFKRFPSWMWRNREVDGFVRWLREHNAALTAEQRVEFRGLDVYSLGSSMREVLDYLDRTDPAAAAAARRRYGCLSPWQEDPADYGRNVMLGQPSCENAVIEQLQALLTQRLAYIDQDGERFFNAERNARVVLAAEHYYRAMYRGSTESWNLHDRHMFDTVRALLDHRGADAKAVVWAHNSHIGNAAATSMGWGGRIQYRRTLPHGFRPRRGADRHGDRPRRGRRGGQLGRADAAQAGHPVAARQLGAAVPAGRRAGITDRLAG